MSNSSTRSARLRVLVVEDSASVAALIRSALERGGFEVAHVDQLGAAKAELTRALPDVVVLDVELPDGSGLQLLRELAAPGVSPVPVVILSSRDDEADRVIGLELGADDYVVKPFYPRELATRVRRAAERRPAGAPTGVITHADLRIDLDTHEVEVRGHAVELTNREFDLLTHLARSPRKVFSRDNLLREVWESSPEWQTPRTVTEHIRRLRQKIEVDPGHPRWIVTVGRAGYRFEP